MARFWFPIERISDTLVRAVHYPCSVFVINLKSLKMRITVSNINSNFCSLGLRFHVLAMLLCIPYKGQKSLCFWLRFCSERWCVQRKLRVKRKHKVQSLIIKESKIENLFRFQNVVLPSLNLVRSLCKRAKKTRPVTANRVWKAIEEHYSTLCDNVWRQKLLKTKTGLHGTTESSWKRQTAILI